MTHPLAKHDTAQTTRMHPRTIREPVKMQHLVCFSKLGLNPHCRLHQSDPLEHTYVERRAQSCKDGQILVCCVLPGFCLLGLRCCLLGYLTILVTMSCIPIGTSRSDMGLCWRPLCVGLRLIQIPKVGDDAPGWGPAGPVPTCSCLQSYAYVSMHTKMSMNACLLCEIMKPAW